MVAENLPGKLHGLDHLRALAIVLVLMYHYRAFKHPGWIDTVGQFGWTGVDLFFVLSGFLISGQLFREIGVKGKISFKIFFTRRFFRIIPPYLFTLFLYFCIPFFREREALPSFWKFMTFTQNYGLDVISRGTFSHAWSLCIEEQFYFFLPILLLITVKTGIFRYMVPLCMLLIVFSLAARAVAWQMYTPPFMDSEDFWKSWYMNIYYPTHTRLDGLAVGVLAGFLMNYSEGVKRIIHRNGNLLFVLGILLLSFSFWFCRDQVSQKASVFGFTFVALSYGIIVMAAVSETSFLFRTESYITTQLAGLSYAVYLSHKGIIHMVQFLLEKQGIQTSDNLSLLIGLSACLAGGLFYRFFIEKPSSRLKNRILAQKQAT